MSQIIPINIPTYISDQNYSPSRVLPRLLFFNGMIDSQTWWIESGSTSIGGVTYQQNAFPYFDNYNVVTGSFPTTNSDSLLFYNEQASYGEVPTDSLYSKYWSKYVNLLYNPRTRLVNASAIIPLAEYVNMELNDIVEFRGNDYHLRAINDYNLTTGECNIQLLGPILEGSLNVEPLNQECSFTFSSVDDSIMELELFTTASNYNVQLPINYNIIGGFGQVPTLFTASWGDGTITYVSGSGDVVNSSHTYTSPGTYKIGLTGSLDTFYTSPNVGERSINLVLKKVNKWGNLSATALGFSYCPVLESIPNGDVGLYNIRYLNDFLATTIATGVPTASKLETLPSDLFKFSQCAINATNFASNNRNLKVVPENLFYYNPNINGGSMFFLCTGITTLPNVLFSPPPNAINTLNGTFRGTTSLTAIPNSLFDNISGSAASPKTINLTSVFRQITTTNALTGNAPALWDSGSYPYLTASLSTNAFTNCTGLTNYASIPAGWK
jgi:hypothetical protein